MVLDVRLSLPCLACMVDNGHGLGKAEQGMVSWHKRESLGLGLREAGGLPAASSSRTVCELLHAATPALQHHKIFH